MVQDERGRKYEAPAKIYTYEMNNEMSTHISVAAGLLPPDGGLGATGNSSSDSAIYKSKRRFEASWTCPLHSCQTLRGGGG